MEQPISVLSPTGVAILNDFRDNLIIDRYDPLFVTMRASKLKHLRSENSEDAVTWNVFRSLRQVAPEHWLPTLSQRGFPGVVLPADQVTVALWQPVNPPRSLLRDADEGASEIDVAIQGGSWVWFIEAKYHSDIAAGTTTRPTRDQVLRNIDVGSYYAGARDFYFSLLIKSESRSPTGVETVRRYGDFTVLRALLPHRPDGLSNLRGVGTLTWADLAVVLDNARAEAIRPDERDYAERAGAWLRGKGLVPAA